MFWKMDYSDILYDMFCFAILCTAVIFILIYIKYVVHILIQKIDYERKVRLLKTHGCERYLSGVPSVGDGAFYGWKTGDGKINIDERDVKHMKYSRLKEMLAVK